MPVYDGRNLPWPVVGAFVKDIAFNSPGLAAGTFEVGRLPAGATVINCIVRVGTAFNAATTNVLVVGTESDDDAFIAAATVDEAAANAGTRSGLATMLGYTVPAGGEQVLAKYTQTGTAATAGTARIIVEFLTHVD